MPPCPPPPGAQATIEDIIRDLETEKERIKTILEREAKNYAALQAERAAHDKYKKKFFATIAANEALRRDYLRLKRKYQDSRSNLKGLMQVCLTESDSSDAEK